MSRFASLESKSANTIAGFLPPSSSESFLNFGAAAAAIVAPVRVLPVNEIALTSACSTSGWPTPGPVPCTMLKHARRKSGFDRELAEQRRGARRDLRRLGDDRVAGRERRRDLPGEQIQRQVPRRDARDDAERLAQRVVERAIFHRMRFARPLRDRGGEEAQIRDRARNVERLGELHGLAGVARFERGECVEIALDEIGEAIEQARAFFGRRRGPGGCCAMRGCDGGSDVVARRNRGTARKPGRSRARTRRDSGHRAAAAGGRRSGWRVERFRSCREA